MNQRLDEAAEKIYRVLLERFGEPIGDAPTTVGVADEREDLKEAKKRKGPTKKAAKSWVKGTKTFKDKVKKAKKAGAKSPEGLAAWMQHRATGKWPSEE